MNRKEADKLKIGDRVVIWDESPDAASGTVTEVGYCAIRFLWDDDGKHTVIHKNDMRNVSPYYGAEPKIPVAA